MRNSEHNPESTKRSLLDDQLDAALSMYSAVELRAGLEERILARVKAAQNRPVGAVWRRWALATACASIATAALLWEVEARRQAPAAHQQSHRQITLQAQENLPGSRARRNQPLLGKQQPLTQVAAPNSSAALPRLEQFPSPQPLTEEERSLARYVSQFGRQAVLLARIQTEEIRQERILLEKATQAGHKSDSSEQDQNTVNR